MVRAAARRAWPLLAISLAVVVVTTWSRHVVFPALSWNRDEPVYLWQLDVLRDGRLTAPDGGFPEFFHPWLSAAGDGRLFSQYTLGWPLALLVSDVLTGSPASMLVLGALLAVLGTYALARELTGDRTLALTAAAVFTLSPIIAVQGGVYLGYLFTLGLGLFFATLLLAGVRRASRWRLVAAGLLLGFIFLTRPYDAVLWGGAVAAYVLVEQRGAWPRVARAAVPAAAGLLPLVAIALAYNRHVTGSLTQFPITAADPLDTFGFGERRLMPLFEPFDYGVLQALKSTARNAFAVPFFLAGGFLGLVYAGAGLWFRRRDRAVLALLALGAVFPAGYFFFWGMHVSGITARISGPIYFVPAYAPLAILVAACLVTVGRTSRARAGLLAVLLVAATVPFAADRLDLNRGLSEAQQPWKETTEAIDGRALVFVADTTYLLFLNPFSSNHPELDDRVLYAVDRGTANFELLDAMPDRTPYLQRASRPSDELAPGEHPVVPEVSVEAVEVVAGRAVALRVRATNPGGAPVVVAWIEAGGRMEQRVLSTASRAGAEHRTEWTLMPAGTAVAGAVAVDGAGVVRVGLGFGDDVEDAGEHRSVRQTVSYRVRAGALEVLMPAEESRWLFKGDRDQWVPYHTDPELVLDARATSG